MTVAISRVIEVMERLAPSQMAMEGDNIGLQTPCAPNIDKILLSLDVDVRVVNEAKRRRAGLIIAHHPVIYTKLDRITGSSVPGRVIIASIRNEVGIYVAHTNLDSASDGVNDVLAHRLELQSVRTLKIAHQAKNYKIAVFVPEDYADKVRAAMCEAGGGKIGEYSYCTFQTPGTGTFLPSAQATPFLGSAGKLNRESELRLEVLVPEFSLAGVIEAMTAAHPYEEVAYDVYELANPGPGFGLGRIGELPEAVHFKDYVDLVKRRLGIKRARVIGRDRAKIRRVAVCGGSGGDLIPNVLAERADAYVTGELKYHQMLNADAFGLCVVEAGHGATERVALPVLAENIQKHIPQVDVVLSRIKTDRSDWV